MTWRGIALAVVLAAMAAALLSAAAEKVSPAHPKPHHVAPAIPLSTTLRFVIRPTLLGLVPPDDPQDFGEVLVRVVSISGAALGLRYEIKERIQKEVAIAALPDAGAQAADAQPKSALLPERSRRAPKSPESGPALTKIVDATRIRRGLITAQRDPASHRIDAPLFWDDGDWQTDSGALWLSHDSFLDLKSGKSITWDPNCQAWGESEMAQELRHAIRDSREAHGLAQDADLKLAVDSTGTYPCIVNGERADLPALIASDNLGLAKYWILADENNPLVLKLAYLAQDETGGPVTDAAPVAATAAETPPAAPAKADDPRRKRVQLPERSRQHSLQSPPADDTPSVTAAKPAADNAAPDLIGAGSGFAVVEINF